MIKLKTLKPRVELASLNPVRAVTTEVQRLTGRRRQVRNARWLAKHPLCVHCDRHGRVTPAVEVDHAVPLHLGGREDRTNLQGLCGNCHKLKTAAEAEDRGGHNFGAF